MRLSDDEIDALNALYRKLVRWMHVCRWIQGILLWGLLLLVPLLVWLELPDFKLTWTLWVAGALLCGLAHSLRIYFRKQAHLVHEHLEQNETDYESDTDTTE